MTRPDRRTHETRDTEITFLCREEPSWQVHPVSALIESGWDGDRHELTIRISHEQGAVEVTLSRPGT